MINPEFINKGTSKTFSTEKNGKIIAYNKIAITVSFLVIPFSIINVYFDKPELIAVNVTTFLLTAITLILNRKGKNEEALFIFFHVSVFTLIVYHYLLGPSAHLEYLTFPYFICVFTCYSKQQYQFLLYYSLLIGASFMLINFGNNLFPSNAQNHSKEYLTLMSNLLYFISIAGCILATFFFDFENKRREKQLKSKNTKAEETLKQKTTFFSMLSHEIRTPLHGIIGLSELLSEKKTLPQSIVDKLNIINFSAKSLKNIIGDILDYSKIEEGKLTITSSQFNPEQLIKDTVKGHKLRAENKGINIHTTIDKLPPLIKSDEFRIAQIISILVDNAIKFTYSGQISVEVSNPNTKNKNTLNIIVTDTGIGIPDHRKEDVFSPYVQIQSISTRNQEGTGLGLAICKRITELLGGQITLESKLNEGTTINVQIPVEIVAVQKAENKLLKNKNILSGLKGLLVEDNLINQFVCEEVFKSLGISYDLSLNGENAIEKCLNKKYDFIIMDYHMPQMDGFTAAIRIRENEEKFGKLRVPIIISTADSNGADPTKYKKHQIDGHLVKPFTKEDLIKSLSYLKVKFQIKTNLMDSQTILSQISFKGTQIDLPFIQNIFQGDKTSIDQLLDMVTSSIPTQLKEIKDLTAKNNNIQDPADLATLIHNLKSNFRNIGAKDFSLALQIAEESWQKNKDIDTVRQAIKMVEAHLHLISNEKEQLLIN